MSPTELFSTQPSLGLQNIVLVVSMCWEHLPNWAPY